MATSHETCAHLADYFTRYPDARVALRLARFFENLAAFPEDSRVTWVLAMFRERTHDNAITPQAD